MKLSPQIIPLLLGCTIQGEAFQPHTPHNPRRSSAAVSVPPFTATSTWFHDQPLKIGSPTYPIATTTALKSISKLVDELTTTQSPTRTVFVGGKGGVGKTTVSSSLAVTLATDYTSDLKVLIVSTDPAHSLGDALDVDLKVGNGRPIQMTDPLTMGKLYAMEVDTDAALERFQNALSTFDVMKLSDALGVQPELLDGFGLSELSNLLNNPPPGLDELVALSNILNDPEITGNFDVVIVDTAPTGHTLRMLALPEFLDGFLGKLLELRMKLSGMANMLQSFLGGGNEAAATRAQTVDDALNKLEEFRTQMGALRRQLKNDSSTDFVVVSVPTKLSVNESKRLIAELGDQGVKVSNVVVNQCVVGNKGGKDDAESNDAMKKYYERRKAGQSRWINELKSATAGVSSSEEYKSNGSGNDDIHVTEVPFFDVELIGVPALAYVGQTSFANNPNFEYLMDDSSPDDEARFVICGGKGGVGKTTTSSTIAVTMAAAGRNVALVSTDPAHSLGDAFGIDFSGGDLMDVPLIGVPPSDGSLSVLEVDPGKSLGEFKGLIDNLIGGENDQASGMAMGGDLTKTLRDLGEVFDTLPAGTDEVVALAKVIGLVKKGGFDRIVLDTAPTGHTLRMLSTPGFIAELIEKVLAIANKVNSNPMVKMMISSASGEDLDEKAQAAKRALLNFQFQMYDLEDIFSNPEQTEFLIVTVPTELAVRESVRLLNDLTFDAPDMPIKVRNIVANQVLKEDGSDVSTFLNRVADGQQSSIAELRSVAGSQIEFTEVPFLDTEPRGVFGLKVLSAELIKEDEEIISN